MLGLGRSCPDAGFDPGTGEQPFQSHGSGGRGEGMGGAADSPGRGPCPDFLDQGGGETRKEREKEGT